MNKDSSSLHEAEIALMEAIRNAAEKEYFAARPSYDHAVSRAIFCHGFDRGYKAAIKEKS